MEVGQSAARWGVCTTIIVFMIIMSLAGTHILGKTNAEVG